MIPKPNNPAVMPREQTRRPERLFAPPVKQRVEEQQAERIRGGCLCPGGSIWVPTCGGKSGYDDEEEKLQRTPPMPEVPQPLQQRAQPPLLHPLSQHQHQTSRPHSRLSDCSTAVGSHQACPPTKPQESLWKRWRRRIFARGPKNAGE